MTTFKVGDIVQLKSGGPPMTIGSTGPYADNAYICVWFVNEEKKSDVFDSEQLKLFDLTTEDNE